MHSMPRELRCLAFREGDVWVGLCIDLDVATQADSFPQIKTDLAEAISGYISSTLEEKDPVVLDQFLHRRSPLKYRVMWEALHRSQQIQQLVKRFAYRCTIPTDFLDTRQLSPC